VQRDFPDQPSTDVASILWLPAIEITCIFTIKFNIVLEFDDEIRLRTKTMPSSAFYEGWNLFFPDCQTVHVGIETEN